MQCIEEKPIRVHIFWAKLKSKIIDPTWYPSIGNAKQKFITKIDGLTVVR